MQLVMMILDLPLEDGIGGLKWSKSKWSKSFSFRKKKKRHLFSLPAVQNW